MADAAALLPGALRSNVLLQQSLERAQARQQERLATGLKVNSALDGPPAYFAAKGLVGRAGDLQSLKDAMGQAISTIQGADKGIAAVKALLGQARGLTTSALANLEETPAGYAARESLARQFDAILDQVDRVVADSGYRGKNLLAADRTTVAATTDSRRETSDIDGVRLAEVTNAAAPEQYRIRIRGTGRISGDADDVEDIEQRFGLARLRIGGFNSRSAGSFDDFRFELRGKPGRDATLVVTDGDESWTVSLPEARLAALDEAGRTVSMDRTFRSGARLTMEVDAGALRAALQPSGVVTGTVARSVELDVSVTDSRGVTISRSAGTQDQGARLHDGVNSFRFDSGTVRLDIDQALIQEAAESPGAIDGDLGPFDDALGALTVTSADREDTFVRLEAVRSGPGAANVVINQYVRGESGVETFSVVDPNQTPVTIGGALGSAAFSGGGSGLSSLGNHGTFFINRNPGQGGLTTVADGDFSNGELASPHIRDWSVSTQLTVTYGALSGSSRTVTVTDTTGGSYSGTVSAGAGLPAVIRLSGGANDGATIGLFDQGGGAGTRTIDIHVGVGSYAMPLDASAYAWAGFDDIAAWSGFGADSTVSISVGADNSAGAGLRTVSVTHTAVDTGVAAVSNYTIGNGAQQNVQLALTGGANNGAQLRFDVPNGLAGSANFSVVASGGGSSGTAELVIRSPRTGQSSTLVSAQRSAASDANDVRVQLNENNTSSLQVSAVNVQSGAAGLRIDRAANGWRSREDVALAVQDLTAAEKRLESAARALQVGSGILGARMDFTEGFSAALREGADRLVRADQDEEAAASLALTVRRQLAGTVLGLLSANQNNILRLF